MDSYHLACGCMSLLFAVAGALLLRRESESKAPPSHLSYLFPRVLLVGSLLGCIENAALVSLSMLNDSFSPIYYDALTIGADTAADFLVLTGALSSGAFSFHHCTGIATALYCRVTHGTVVPVLVALNLAFALLIY